MKRVIVLGGSGMLGSMVTDVLSRSSDLSLTATLRERGLAETCAQVFPSVNWVQFNASTDDAAVIDGHDWVVNCIGITKPLIHDDNASEVERAIRVNSLFPQRLAVKAKEIGARVLQIATDCVYSGAKGHYVETDPHDALDVYGKTKSLGETVQPWVHNLRCSIIGPEPKDFKFLLEWFIRQPRGAQVNGFTNHRWNGVTTYHFGRVVGGIIRSGTDLPNSQHLIPSGDVTKAEMLDTFAAAYDRRDVTVRHTTAEKVIDRTLETTRPEVSGELWQWAGYPVPPTVPEMIREMAANPNRIIAERAGIAR
jgi:dTDP-4-dehydrorhamnose reductase